MEKYNSELFSEKTDFIANGLCPKAPVLAMAFVNSQPFAEIYGADDALKRGTLWKNLDKPFYGRNTLC